MDMIKNETISEKDVKMLREKFKTQYAVSKGWDPANLTSEQMIEITTQKGWKSPGLILS